MDTENTSPTMPKGMRLSLAKSVSEHLAQVEEQTTRYTIEPSTST